MANAPKAKQFEIKGDEIIVRYKLAPYLSKSEKSYVIGTSHGRDTFSWEGKNVHINFNAYVMKAEWEKQAKPKPEFPQCDYHWGFSASNFLSCRRILGERKERESERNGNQEGIEKGVDNQI